MKKNKDGNDNFDKVMAFLKEEQEKFFDKVYPTLVESCDDNDEILCLLAPHFIDVLAQIIVCSNNKKNLECTKFALDALVEKHIKNEKEAEEKEQNGNTYRDNGPNTP